MEIVLNIGMARAHGADHDLAFVLFVCQRNALSLVEPRVVQSDTERTVVAVVKPLGNPSLDVFCRRIENLALDLEQDCIAVFWTFGEIGRLIGPNAVAWGAFNPEFFIMPDGTRLASPAAKAA